MIRFYQDLVHPKENILSICILLVKSLGVKITPSSLKTSLEEHPDYPSLLSMSDVLKKYHISNLAVKLAIDKLKEVQFPFVALIKSEKSMSNIFCLITKSDSSSVTLLFPTNNKQQVLSWEAFGKIYQNITFLAEADEMSGEIDFKEKSKKEKRIKLGLDISLLYVPFLVLFYGIYTLYSKNINVSLLPVLYQLLSLIGWLACSLLIWYEVDSSNKILQKVCGANGNNKINNYSSVLQ